MPRQATEAERLEWLTPNWPAPSRVGAASSTRLGGLSQAPFASLNLGDHVGDAPELVAANRRLLNSALGLPGEPHWLRQVHGCCVQRVGDEGLAACRTWRLESEHRPQPPPNLPVSQGQFLPNLQPNSPAIGQKYGEQCAAAVDVQPTTSKSDRLLVADAAWSNRPGEVCVVMTADCLPVLLCDAQGTEVAAVHAGWRGLCDGVIEATLGQFSAVPGQLLAWLGPAIGPDAFEVGPEVRAAFLAKDADAALAFRPGDGHRWLADIFLLARQRLNKAGVHRVFGGGLCTYNDPQRFFSYRRDGVTGRMATLIWLEESCT